MEKTISIKNIAVIFSMILLGFTIIMISGCKTTSANITPVSDFSLEKYLGQWYVIGRFDFKHEKNMSYVTTIYSMNDDGSIKVLNKGYDFVENRWKESVGKAKYADKKDTEIAALKVSFFGPFYSGYNVIAIDSTYSYALVAGQNLKYLWILSRTPTMPPEILNNYLDIAKQAGYDTNNLVWTTQTK